MNTRITALKKKIEIKEAQLKSKEELVTRSKETVKGIKIEIELLKNELAKEEMQEMMALMDEKNLDIDDVKAAIASGMIEGSKKKEEKNPETKIDEISKEIEEINESEEDGDNA